eukprot:scaffold12551_cov56-Phaeocystis_antarctica.AAC.1
MSATPDSTSLVLYGSRHSGMKRPARLYGCILPPGFAVITTRSPAVRSSTPRLPSSPPISRATNAASMVLPQPARAVVAATGWM